MLSLRNSNHDPPVDLYDPWERNNDIEVTLDKEQFLSDHYIAHVTPPAYTPSLPFLTTIEPANTLLMGDEDSSTTPASKTDEFIKSSTNDLVPIPREFEVTSGNNLECGMPIDTPSSPYLVVLRDEKINLILRDDLDTLLTGDREIDFNPCRDIEELERLLANDHVPVLRVFDEPLGNSDLMYYDSEGDVLYFEQLLNEDTSSDLSPALLPRESSLLVPSPLASKQFSLRNVERFDPFFSLTQSSGKTRLMKTPSFSFHYMALPRPAAYSPKEVMYRY
ncbi:hypothetical protein Tco_0581958 [Tanacetum coccineum]